MSKYFPPYNNSSENIKVELDLSNYATKKDIKDITHIDASGFASKTNLAALKTKVDKLNIDKLRTTPADLAKLTDIVKNEVVKKTDFNANDYVKRTKFTADTNALDDKIDKGEKKIPGVSDLASKSSVTTLVKILDNRIDNLKIKEYAKKISLSNYMLTSDFNTKSTDLETKINANGTEITSLKSNLSGYAEKTNVADDINKIKNDYATNASLDSKLNDLKSQHIATEVKSIDDTIKKNASDILAFESRLKQKEDIIDDVQRDNALTSGRDDYRDKIYLLYECRIYSLKTVTYSTGDIFISNWKSTGINNYSRSSDLDGGSGGINSPILKDNGRMSARFEGIYLKQNKLVRSNNNNVINVYIVYKLDTVSNTRDDTFTVQNALFGGIKLTKNTDTSKYKYEGYGICFDEGGTFSMGNISDGRNVLIFGVHENSLVHTGNKNNIYVMGDGFVQGINDNTLYAEKTYPTNFSAVNKKFVSSLHYNGDNSYLFVNRKQELKFKAKDDQIVREILCLGNISDDWSVNNVTKTGLYGNVYDFAVDYTETSVGNIYNIHRYLMKKNDVV